MIHSKRDLLILISKRIRELQIKSLEPNFEYSAFGVLKKLVSEFPEIEEYSKLSVHNKKITFS